MASRNFVKSFGLHEGKSLTAFDLRFSHNVGLGLGLRLGRKWVWHRWTTLIVIKREVWGSPVQASLKKNFFFICLGQVLVAIHEMFFAACRIFSCDMQGLLPWPGIEPGPPALGAQSLSQWTTKFTSPDFLQRRWGARPRGPPSHHWFLFLSHSTYSPPTDPRSVVKIYPKSDPDHLPSQHPGPKL